MNLARLTVAHYVAILALLCIALGAAILVMRNESQVVERTSAVSTQELRRPEAGGESGEDGDTSQSLFSSEPPSSPERR
jgi:NADH:ubiquinone oxidoreductase subunit 3 (subunit A)